VGARATSLPRPAGPLVAGRSLYVSLGWGGVVALSCVVAACLVLDRGAVLDLAFPGLATCLGAFLLYSDRGLYIGYASWLWFLTPEVRRLADFQGGYSTINPIMLAPLVVSGLTVFTVAHRAPMLKHRLLFGFVPIAGALAYGVLVGIVGSGFMVAAYALLTWAVPVLLGAYIAVLPENYETHRTVLTSAFGWGAFVMGVYGMVQFFVAPGWDCAWIINSGMLTQGHPVPLEIRVFSTMNSCGPFAFTLCAGLLLLLVGRGWKRLAMAAFGFVSLMLSLVRGAWLGLLLAFFYLLFGLGGKKRMQVLGFMVAVAVSVVGGFMSGPIEQVVTERFDSLYDLEGDGSFQQRQSFYADFLSNALDNVVGSGIGPTSYVTKLSNYGEISSGFYGDSGVMQVPFVLGWFGTILYCGGTVALIRHAFGAGIPRQDYFYLVSKSIVIMIAAEMIFDNTLINVMGACFWMFLGACLAARQHHAIVLQESEDTPRPTGVPVGVPG
jgi:hypothetical protein